MDKKLKEKDIQNLIADFPWLLNPNYSTIPELKRKGMEYTTTSGKRIDLILRNTISNRPVLIEFKATEFNRENIGQILEYRARVLSEMTSDSSSLKSIFGDQLATPILVLVVSTCSKESRIAANLAGIEVYEFKKDLTTFFLPEKQLILKEFAKNLSESVLPISETRHETVKEIEDELLNVLTELGMPNAISKSKPIKHSYWPAIDSLFLNQWLFGNNEISIGIYEDIFDEKNIDSFIFEFFSTDKQKMDDFIFEMDKILPDLDFTKTETDNGEYLYRLPLKKASVIGNLKEGIRPLFDAYIQILGQNNEYNSSKSI
jgi:hypothetical protein